MTPLSSARPWLRGAAILMLAVFAVACGGDDRSAPPSTATLEATTTPAPEPSGRIMASIQASCRAVGQTVELRVSYSARTLGDTLLSRVRLQVDDRTVEDSGPLSQAEYRRVFTLAVEGSSRHSARLIAEAPGAVTPIVSSAVTCSAAPGPRL